MGIVTCDLTVTGRWGPNPPYHAPVFVRTRHEHDDVAMDGGTTFHCVTGGPAEALDRARTVAGDVPLPPLSTRTTELVTHVRYAAGARRA